MSATETTYIYQGRGVVTHNGVDYAKGEILPSDIPRETIRRLETLGAVVTAAKQKAGPLVGALESKIANLEKQVNELTAANKDYGSFKSNHKIILQMITNLKGRTAEIKRLKVYATQPAMQKVGKSSEDDGAGDGSKPAG